MARLGLIVLCCAGALGCSSSDDRASDGGPPDGGAWADAAGFDGGADGGVITTPTRYPPGVVRSPVTESVAGRMRAIAARGPSQRADVFMKVGASGTVSTNLLYCFAGAPYRVDLDGRTALQPTIDHFRTGRVGTTTPFDRDTLAAVSGKTAAWALSGNPSPLSQEMAIATPRFAFVNYGTNDMEAAATYPAALAAYWDNMQTLLDQLEAAGIVPIITGLNPRSDTLAAARWVPAFDAATRALAEVRQLPYISLDVLSSPLAGLGLGPDGLHGTVYPGSGQAQPCVFTAAGLAFNYNARNLASIQTLDAVERVVLDGAPAPDRPVLPAVTGAGTQALPFVIDQLGFTHGGDTRAGERRRDRYPACDQGQDESGPEMVYRLSLAAATPVRIVALDRGATDVDVHLLSGDTCLARNDRVIERALPAGDYTIVVDSFVSGGGEKAGPYALIVVRCDSGDPACN